MLSQTLKWAIFGLLALSLGVAAGTDWAFWQTDERGMYRKREVGSEDTLPIDQPSLERS